MNSNKTKTTPVDMSTNPPVTDSSLADSPVTDCTANIALAAQSASGSKPLERSQRTSLQMDVEVSYELDSTLVSTSEMSGSSLSRAHLAAETADTCHADPVIEGESGVALTLNNAVMGGADGLVPNVPPSAVSHQEPSKASTSQAIEKNLNIATNKSKRINLNYKQRTQRAREKAIESGVPYISRKKNRAMRRRADAFRSTSQFSSPVDTSGNKSSTHKFGEASLLPVREGHFHGMSLGTPQYSKRDRPANETHSPGECIFQKPSKKGKTHGDLAVESRCSSQGQTFAPYSKAAGDLRMAIVPENYPAQLLTDVTVLNLQIALNKEVIKMKPGPRFDGVHFEGGALQITCADDASRESLLLLIQSKINGLGGLNYRIGLAKDVFRTYKLTTWVPALSLAGVNGSTDFIEILGNQNPQLNISGVRVIKTTECPKGKIFVLLAGDNFLNGLRRTGLKSYFGLSQINFRIHD